MKWFHINNSVEEAGLRLFCFPYAGAGASLFSSWRSYLPDNVELYALQMPGRENRFSEQHCTDMQYLVDHLIEEMQAMSDLPFIIYGHSMGALIAYELTKQLSSKQLKLPSHLLVAGKMAPHFDDGLHQIHQLEDQQFISELHHRYGGLDDVINEPELLELIIPILKSDIQLIEQYTPEVNQLINVPISAIVGCQDQSVNKQGISAWRELSALDYSCDEVPGGHFFVKESFSILINRIINIIRPYLDSHSCQNVVSHS